MTEDEDGLNGSYWSGIEAQRRRSQIDYGFGEPVEDGWISSILPRSSIDNSPEQERRVV